MREFCTPGSEKWEAEARRRVEELTRMRRALDLPALNRYWVPEEDVLVFLSSTKWAEGYYISGGRNYIVGDPWHPLWEKKEALLPATRPDAAFEPLLPFTMTIQHVSTLYLEASGAYVRRHWLVICRFCKRVAEYTWDEVKTFNATEPEKFTITGAYVSNEPDGAWVTVRDTAEDGSTATRDLIISPTLKQQSDDNPWGWLENGPNDKHPGPPPPAPDLWAIDYSRRQDDVTPIGYSGPFPPSPIYASGPTDVATLAPGEERTNTLPGPLHASSGRRVREPLPAPAGTYLGLPHYAGVDLYNDEYYGTLSGPWLDGIQAEVDAHNAPLQAAYDADLAAYNIQLLNRVRAIVEQISTLMWDKKIGTPDVTELTLPDGGLLHKTVKAAIVSDTTCAAELSFTTSVSGVPTTIVLAFDSVFDPLILGNIYGVPVLLSDPANPAPPDLPWSVVVDDSKRCKYSSGSKAFSSASAKAGPTLRSAAFSRSVVTPLYLGQTVAIRPSGLFEVTKAAYTELSAFQLDNLMKRLCVGNVSDAELGLILLHSTKDTKQAKSAKAYRATEHVHANGVYSFTQPVI